MEEFYPDSQAHLFDELLLIDLIIHAQVLKFRAAKNDNNTLKGLYISDEEIDKLLMDNPSYDKWVDEFHYTSDEYERLDMAITALNAKIKKKIGLSLEKGIKLKLLQLADIFKLNSFETHLLIICLAPQFDSKYRKLFAYLQDDVTRKDPSVELVIKMICPTFRERNAVRKCFSMQAPLFKNGILTFVDSISEPDKPDIVKGLQISKRLVGYILDDDTLEDDLSFFTHYYTSTTTLKNIILPGDIKRKLCQFVSYYNSVEKPRNFIFSFYGKYGTQKLEVAGALCHAIGTSLIVVDMLALYNSGIFFERAIDMILRESKINFLAVFLENCNFLFEGKGEDSYLRRYFIDQFDKYSLLTFISSSEMLPIHGEFTMQKLISLEIPVPDYLQRKLLWDTHLEEFQLDPDVNIKELAGKYNLTGGQIKEVVSTAGVYALWEAPLNPVITIKNIEEACHVHSNQRLNRLAQRIKPRHTWDDIILEEPIKTKLQELVKMFRYKHVVYSEWGFDRKLSLGKGISALFFGEPGTGKTLASEIIAHELGMDLYKIDISTVVSKYIGETEKNLANIFSEAESSNAILFFDEADAIFGKRTEIRDSHDRYSNIEVSYLLQRIDEYNGIVIMATNFNKNIDQAFERRLHFSIRFPLPEAEMRLAIWKNIFPVETPLSDDIDFKILAKKIDLPGGNIKNIALQAAFYAADTTDGQTINMSLLKRACESEYKKIGRLWDKDLLVGKQGLLP